MRVIDDITNFVFLEDISSRDAMGEGGSIEERLSIEEGSSMKEGLSMEEGSSMKEGLSMEEGSSMEKRSSMEKGLSMKEGNSIEGRPMERMPGEEKHVPERDSGQEKHAAKKKHQAMADVIFIPGGSYPELPERAAELWKAGYAPYVVPSGCYSVTAGRFSGVKSKADIYRKNYATECEFYTDVLLSNGVDPGSILPEAQAQFTAENARLSRKVLDGQGIHPKKAILCCKGYHSRRCLMYYQINFPDTEFLIAPVYIDITRENWYYTERGRKKVLGELKRLGTQFTPELTPEWQAFQDKRCESQRFIKKEF